MTTEQTSTDLIRYPVAVRFDLQICDTRGHLIATGSNIPNAAEIIRILNLHHERGVAERAASDKPATVASGEPSKEAMDAAHEYYGNGKKSLASVIDAAFAPKLTELERQLKAENENVMKWVRLNQLTERERDEMRSKHDDARNENVQLANRCYDAERERDEANYWMHQLRSDLDEAVSCIEDIDMMSHDVDNVCMYVREYFSKKRKPPTGEVETPETATELAAAAGEFLSGMGEPVDLEEVTIPRKEFERAKKEIAEVASLRRQLAERDATIERLNRTVAKHMLRAAKDGWQQGEAAFKLLLSDPDFYRAEENAKVV